jgi:hypothetical protein
MTKVSDFGFFTHSKAHFQDERCAFTERLSLYARECGHEKPGHEGRGRVEIQAFLS